MERLFSNSPIGYNYQCTLFPIGWHAGAQVSRNQSKKQSPSDQFDRFLGSLIHGDASGCALVTEHKLDNQVSILDLYQGLFQPALYRIGDLWAANRLSVATEHMATAITEGLMNRLYPRLVNRNRCGLKVVMAPVEGELHQVGAKMAADVFEMHGWDCLFLGGGQTTERLLSELKDVKPDMLGLSFSVFYHMDILQRMLTRIRAEYSDLPILVGGQGLSLGGTELEEAFKVTCVRNLDELDALLAHIHN